MAVFMVSLNHIIWRKEGELGIGWEWGLKTWEQVESDRKLVESQQRNSLYLNQGKADGGDGSQKPHERESY